MNKKAIIIPIVLLAAMAAVYLVRRNGSADERQATLYGNVDIREASLAFRVAGRVDSLAPATGALFSLLPPENATGNFTKVVQRIPVKIVIDSSDDAHRLAPGMSVIPSVTVR